MDEEKDYYILVPKNSVISFDEIELKHCYSSHREILEKLTPIIDQLPILVELLEVAKVSGYIEDVKIWKSDSKFVIEKNLAEIKEYCNRRTSFSKIRWGV